MPDVAFIGKAGSGKTTAASILFERWSYQLRSFAGPLKAMAAELFPNPNRPVLQAFGNAVRAIDEDAWVRMLLHSLPLDRAVVDDCRMPNEYWALKERGFVIVRITAPLDQRCARLVSNGKWAGEEVLKDYTEVALDEFEVDYEITNDGDWESLTNQVTAVALREAGRV